ncbi:hypothetical protein HaLaN_17644 [Haematococcus lacustris]|uniref:GST C-terminal domain-containing protein n=1 Tax=Haematococcus lacustris TaxID=44745 RepID=A0A699ZQ31_HAELA|nr:hypothetical protein HaLaN_17644 [Haematococcus lacustris]
MTAAPGGSTGLGCLHWLDLGQLQVAPSQRQRDVVAMAVRELHERTMQLETLLSPKGPFANGSTLTLADCAYPAAFLSGRLP